MHLFRASGADRSLSTILASVALMTLIGCDALPLGGAAAVQSPNNAARQMPPVRSPVPEDESAFNNNEFVDAQPATLPLDGAIVIEGAIDVPGDVDMYMLGPAFKGDQIVIEVYNTGGMNTVAALFDGAGDLIDQNNDRSFYAGLVDPYITQVLRTDTTNLYVAITVSTARNFATGSSKSTGGYSIKCSRKQGFSVAPATSQVVYCDFAGGDRVQIALEPIETMRPFSAESISGRFAGQTNYMIDRIMEHMRSDLAPFNVTLLDGRHDPRPPEPYTKLYFGNYNAAYLGLADNVDTYNQYLAQEAIIYAEDLALYEVLFPSVDQAALALANIGAHELGHLLGLEHCGEADDVMATAATARQIFDIDATYKRSVLERSIFPVGWQDGWSALAQNVGLKSGVQGARVKTEDWMPASPASTIHWDPTLPDMPINMCGGCAGDHGDSAP